MIVVAVVDDDVAAAAAAVSAGLAVALWTRATNPRDEERLGDDCYGNHY